MIVKSTKCCVKYDRIRVVIVQTVCLYIDFHKTRLLLGSPQNIQGVPFIQSLVLFTYKCNKKPVMVSINFLNDLHYSFL